MRKVRKDKVPEKFVHCHSKIDFTGFIKNFICRIEVLMRQLSRADKWVLITENGKITFFNNDRDSLLSLLLPPDADILICEKEDGHITVSSSKGYVELHPLGIYNEKRGLPI